MAAPGTAASWESTTRSVISSAAALTEQETRATIKMHMRQFIVLLAVRQ
jgi:hypothetical protein